MTSDTATAPGRPQDEELTGKILSETIDQLRTGGYASLRIEKIAAMVGCSKATIYRRWPSRAELTAAALSANASAGDLPDTGNIIDDLAEHAWRNPRNDRLPDGSPRNNGTLWAVIVEPEVREILLNGFLDQRRSVGLALISRGVERGELPPNVDAHLILDLLAGFTLYRGSVRNITIGKDDYRPIVASLVASPPLMKPEPAGR